MTVHLSGSYWIMGRNEACCSLKAQPTDYRPTIKLSSPPPLPPQAHLHSPPNLSDDTRRKSLQFPCQNSPVIPPGNLPKLVNSSAAFNSPHSSSDSRGYKFISGPWLHLLFFEFCVLLVIFSVIWILLRLIVWKISCFECYGSSFFVCCEHILGWLFEELVALSVR